VSPLIIQVWRPWVFLFEAVLIFERSIIFRALQGLGGAGVYALAILCIYEIAPKTKLPVYSGLMSFCLALASLIGPIIGGALAHGEAWRWVFFIKYGRMYESHSRMTD